MCHKGNTVHGSQAMTTAGTVRLAAIGYQAGFQIDDFLRRVADRLRADRVSLGGDLAGKYRRWRRARARP